MLKRYDRRRQYDLYQPNHTIAALDRTCFGIYTSAIIAKFGKVKVKQ